MRIPEMKVLKSPSNRKWLLPVVGGLSLTISSAAVVWALTMSSYQTALIPIEGGTFQGVNGSHLGAFQLGNSALQDAGYMNADGTWNASAQALGVNSNADFLNNPAAQVAIDNAYNAKETSYMTNYNSLIGTKDAATGTTLTSGALTYCAESLGAGGCEHYLQSGTLESADSSFNLAQWQQHLATMSTTNTGDSANVSVANTSTTNADGSTTTTTAVAGVFCEPAIMNQMAANGATMVDNWTTLASRPETGYTLLGGQSVLEAAGLLTQGQPGYVGSTGMFGNTGGTFGQASCLDNLLSGGMNLVFNPPNLSSILAQLTQAACNEVTQLFTSVTAPISRSVYQSFDESGVIPGLNLSGLSTGIGLSSSSGNGNSGINISAGGSNYNFTPDTGWYGGSAAPATTGYGSLFGSSGSTGPVY